MRYCLVAVFVWWVSSSAKAQSFVLRPDSYRIERGETHRLTLVVTTDSVLRNVTVRLRTPRGFFVTEDSDSLRFREVLPQRQSLVYGIRSNLFTSLFRRGLRAGDSIQFLAQITYERAGVQQHQEAEVRMLYTTAKSVYLLSGTLGLLVGFLIKARTRRETDGPRSADQTRWRRLTQSKPGELTTLLLIGVPVLLYLARDSMPAMSWDQSILLGIGLGVVGDETLLKKLGGGT